MKKVLTILVILICLFSLSSLCLGTTIDGLFTGTSTSAEADDYGQFLISLENILGWFEGFGDFFRGTLDFIRNVGTVIANAWDVVCDWVARSAQTVVSTCDNIVKFFSGGFIWGS